MKIITDITIVLLLCIQLLFAATVSLKGTVKDEDGNSIEGVNISLINKSDLFTTTDAQGGFRIDVTKTLQSKLINQTSLNVSITKNKLVISPVFGNIHGIIDVFSSNGRLNSSVQFRGTSTGNQTLNLPKLASGLNIIRVTIGEKSITRTFFILGNSGCFVKNYVSTGNPSLLVNQAAVSVIDTLIAEKEGYTDTKVALESYDKQNVQIVMREITSGEMPLVYNEEFTGKDCPKPVLVDDPTALPSITYLPDPFLMADGSTRMTTRDQWRCRRAEIKAILEKYDTGTKPDKPDKVSATLSGNKVNITVNEGSNSITMSATINYVNGIPSEPVPAIIGVSMMSPGHSLPSGELSKRGIATVFFDPIQVAAHTGARNTGNFYKLYPNLTTSGNMIRWAWAVSRLIDALELLPEAKIDLSHLAVSGCSYAGKVALFAGAFDERIALTLPHESGGGGTISWRYSDMLEDRDNTEVENLHHAQGAEWYASILAKYKPLSVSPNTLPYDHHELIGMIAPRAVLCIESSQIARMGGEAARIDALAARSIWKALGVEDRMGATEENTGHCTWHNGFTADLGAYLDKFLLGKETNTDILRSKFTSIDTAKWIPWETPVLK